MGVETVYAANVSKATAAIAILHDVKRLARKARAVTHVPWWTPSPDKVSYVQIFPDLERAALRAEGIAEAEIPFLEAFLKQMSIKAGDESWQRKYENRIATTMALAQLVHRDIKAWLEACTEAFRARNVAQGENYMRLTWDEYSENMDIVIDHSKEFAKDVLAETGEIVGELNAEAAKLATQITAGAVSGVLAGIVAYFKANPLALVATAAGIYLIWKYDVLNKGLSGLERALETGSRAATGTVG